MNLPHIKKTMWAVYLCLCVSTSSVLFAHTDALSNRADYHAPIMVMGDHKHAKGETMVSYRYQTMTMSQLKQGADDISLTDVHDKGFMMAPKSMNMSMHMVGLMRGITDKITLMAMVPYKSTDMTMEMKMMNGSTQLINKSSDGIGDVNVSALMYLTQSNTAKTALQFGTTLPTGAIDQNGGYGVQLGSGTIDPFVRLTYTQFRTTWSWGNQLSALVRYGENSKKYALGDVYSASAWLSKLWTSAFSTSIRINGTITGDLEGQNEAIGSTQVNQTGRTYADLVVGANVLGQTGWRNGIRLGAEVGFPVYERVSGIQLSREYWAAIGLQKTF